MNVETMTTEQINARLTEIRARQADLREQEKTVTDELSSLAEEMMSLSNPLVRQWEDPTPEQLLSLGGTDEARSIVDSRVEHAARGHRISRSGFQTEKRGQYYVPRAASLGSTDA
jgi:hypothetical protein